MSLPKILLPLAALVALAVPSAAQAAAPGVNLAGAPTPDRITEAIDAGAKSVRIFALWNAFEPNAPQRVPVQRRQPAQHLQHVRRRDQAAQRRGRRAALRRHRGARRGPTAAPPTSTSRRPTRTTSATSSSASPPTTRPSARSRATRSGTSPTRTPSGIRAPTPSSTPPCSRPPTRASRPATRRAAVVAGPTTGNNYAWLENLYTAGAAGSFDVVAVHTDTACLDRGPGRVLPRERRAGALHVPGLPHGARHDGRPRRRRQADLDERAGLVLDQRRPDLLHRGTWAGQKPSGVSEANQAAFLTKAYSCLANDPYVTQGRLVHDA